MFDEKLRNAENARFTPFILLSYLGKTNKVGDKHIPSHSG